MDSDIYKDVESKIDGTRDLFPEDHKYLTFLKKVFRHEFRKNGFRRISVPSFENLDLLRKVFPQDQNTYGLYTFADKVGHSLALVPTATVGTMRSYINNERYDELQPISYYYIDKFFRQGRPEKEAYLIG